MFSPMTFRLQQFVSGLAIVAATALWTAGAAHAEKRVALVIGNDRYINMPADRQLQKAANDAHTLAQSMQALGFEVLVGTNLSRQAMIDKLAEFTARLEAGDTAAFFFAGHGVAIQGVNYLVPGEVYRLEKPVKTWWLKFTIEGVYPGKTYSDTAISKLLVASEPAR